MILKDHVTKEQRLDMFDYIKMGEITQADGDEMDIVINGYSAVKIKKASHGKSHEVFAHRELNARPAQHYERLKKLGLLKGVSHG